MFDRTSAPGSIEEGIEIMQHADDNAFRRYEAARDIERAQRRLGVLSDERDRLAGLAVAWCRIRHPAAGGVACMDSVCTKVREANLYAVEHRRLADDGCRAGHTGSSGPS